MTPVRTPMGPAVPGGRLDRLAEGQRIIQAMIEQGATNRSIAAAIGWHNSTVADFRNGTRAPSAEQLARLRSLASGDAMS